MIMALRSDMRLYGIDTKEGRERQRASVREHYQMIEYAAAGDSERIGALINKHIMEWKPLFIAALKRRVGVPPKLPRNGDAAEALEDRRVGGRQGS